MNSRKERGFSLLWLIVLLAVFSIAGAGYYLYTANNQNSLATEDLETKELLSDDGEIEKLYEIENEGLSFLYNPNISYVEFSNAEVYSLGEIYMESVELRTGSAVLSIWAGAYGIGGSASCSVNRGDECEVIDKTISSFLGEEVVYRLVKGIQTVPCGFEGSPSCDIAPLGTYYYIDTVPGEGEPYKPCCGVLSLPARNLGGKSTEGPGTNVIEIIADEEIMNDKLLNHPDIVETIRIIETIDYRSI